MSHRMSRCKSLFRSELKQVLGPPSSSAVQTCGVWSKKKICGNTWRIKRIETG